MRADRCQRSRRHGGGEDLDYGTRSFSGTERFQIGEPCMSARQSETSVAIPHPRETMSLFGHRDAELALLHAFQSGRIPHAWLIGGAQGIGKATLAYRMARFVLANRDPLSRPVQETKTLQVDPSHPVARHIASGAH